MWRLGNGAPRPGALTSKTDMSGSTMDNTKRGTLMTFCNPLLDITARVSPSFLAKYGLLPNDSILSGPSHTNLTRDLFEDYSAGEISYSAGGAGQNSTRAAQWLLPPGSTVYCGCIGKDEFGSKLREQAMGDGLQVEYMVTSKAPTGTCLCLLTDGNRSLVASLNAADHFASSHLLSDHMQSVMHSSSMLYISGFFVTVSMDSIRYALGFARREGKGTAFNLSAPFLCEHYGEQLDEIIGQVDFLFGNESEALAYYKRCTVSTGKVPSIEAAVQELAKHAKHVIITQGSSSTIYGTGSSISSFPVKPVHPDEIVDTNGAGDAFVGGFLAAFLGGHPIDRCIECGHCMASMVIKTLGVSFDQSRRPSSVDEFLLGSA